MLPRSNVVTMLPPYIRQEIERRLFDNGFRDYEGLAQWVRGQGYEISDDSLWRYGHGLQQQFAAARITMLQARAWADLSAGSEGSMAMALITIAQQKAIASLLETEQVKPADLNAIANLIRAGLAHQRSTAERSSRNHTPLQPRPPVPPASEAITPHRQNAVAAPQLRSEHTTAEQQAKEIRVGCDEAPAAGLHHASPQVTALSTQQLPEAGASSTMSVAVGKPSVAGPNHPSPRFTALTTQQVPATEASSGASNSLEQPSAAEPHHASPRITALTTIFGMAKTLSFLRFPRFFAPAGFEPVSTRWVVLNE
jgi:hypothetical protein